MIVGGICVVFMINVRLVARLVVIAEGVEEVLGLEPLPEPKAEADLSVPGDPAWPADRST